MRYSALKGFWAILFCCLIFFPCLAWGENVKQLFEEGQNALTSGQFKEAIAAFEKVIEMEPNFAPAYNGLAMAHREAKTDINEVIWLLRTAIQIDPNYVQAYDNLSKAYYNIGNFDKAEETCLDSLAINPNQPGTQLSLAWIYLIGKSEPDKAVYYFKKVVETNKIPMAYYGLGMAYLMTDDKPMTMEAITELRNMGKEDLATQLETMMRGKASGTTINPSAGLAQNVLPTTSLPNQNPPASAPSASSANSPNKKSIMKVRLRGKIIPDDEATSTASLDEDAAARLERIKRLHESSQGASY